MGKEGNCCNSLAREKDGFAMEAMIEILQNIDWQILRWIHSTLGCHALDFLMPKISLLGNAAAIWLICAFLMLLTKKHRKYGITLLIGLTLSFIIGSICLQPLLARPRPCWLETDIRLLIPKPADYSFPSGHTLSSFAAATILMRWNRQAGRLAFLLASLIAFSRLYLFVHFPSDVLGGAVLGVLTGYLSITLVRLLPGK
jgi:undecaprenyl-diphosphatase